MKANTNGSAKLNTIESRDEEDGSYNPNDNNEEMMMFDDDNMGERASVRRGMQNRSRSRSRQSAGGVSSSISMKSKKEKLRRYRLAIMRQ